MESSVKPVKISWLVREPKSSFLAFLLGFFSFLGLAMVAFMHYIILFEYDEWLHDLSAAELFYALLLLFMVGRFYSLGSEAGEIKSHLRRRFNRLTAIWGWLPLGGVLYLLFVDQSYLYTAFQWDGPVSHLEDMLYLYGWLMIIYFGTVKPKYAPSSDIHTNKSVKELNSEVQEERS